MSKGYTDKTTIENYLLTEIDSSFDMQIDDWITAMETYIDQMTGRNFIADESASIKRFDGDRTSTLIIDDCVEVESVQLGTEDALVIDESSDGSDDPYYVYPPNMLPKTRIKLLGNIFPSYPPQAIRVSAKWGYSVEVPADIKNACTILVSGIINYSNNADGEIKSMSIGRYTVTYKDEKQWQDFERVTEVFSHYKKYQIV